MKIAAIHPFQREPGINPEIVGLMPGEVRSKLTENKKRHSIPGNIAGREQ
jgi:hypothetical protein